MKFGNALFFFACLSLAAVPGGRELEILSMPFKNQVATFTKDEKTYARLIAIAEDVKIPFSKRWKSIVMAVEIKKEKAIGDLDRLSRSKEWFIKNAVLVSLRTINTDQKWQISRRLLKDPSLVVRSAAADVFIQDGLEQHRDWLWEEVFNKQNFKKSQSLWIRPQLIRALAQNPRNHEKNLFLKLLSENESDILHLGLYGAQKLAREKPDFAVLTDKDLKLKVDQMKSKLLAFER